MGSSPRSNFIQKEIKMKKALTLLCIGACLFTLAACQDEKKPDAKDPSEKQEENKPAVNEQPDPKEEVQTAVNEQPDPKEEVQPAVNEQPDPKEEVKPATKDEHEEAINDQFVWMGDLTKAMKTIKDVDSANAAKEELENLMAIQKELMKKMEELGAPTEERGNELKKKYEKKMKEASMALNTEMRRVMKDPALVKIIGPAMTGTK